MSREQHAEMVCLVSGGWGPRFRGSPREMDLRALCKSQLPWEREGWCRIIHTITALFLVHLPPLLLIVPPLCRSNAPVFHKGHREFNRAANGSLLGAAADLLPGSCGISETHRAFCYAAFALFLMAVSETGTCAIFFWADHVST